MDSLRTQLQCGSNDTDNFSIGLCLKTYLAIGKCKKGVVLPLAHVDAGMDMGPALTDEDVAGQNGLTVAPLHAQALRLRVAAVPGGAHALFVGEELKTNFQHCITPP